jgi:hypothetical protein
MKTALEQFHEEIQRVRNLIAIYDYLRADPKNTLDSSDILRGCMVLLVSALDAFVHDIVRIGMMQILRGDRTQTKTYQKVGFTLQQIDFDPTYSWFERQIREKTGRDSFQTPENIENAIKYISEKDLWTQLSQELQSDNKDDIKRHLRAIVDRRNQIAHEADIDMGLPAPTKRSIESEDIKDAVDFIEKLANAVYQMLNP